MIRRPVLVAAATLLAVCLSNPNAVATPVAKNKQEWQTYGRVFLEPSASYNYIQFGNKGRGEFAQGFHLLEKLYPRYLHLTTMAKELHNPNAVSVGKDGFPAWDSRDTGDGQPLYVVIVTDNKVPDQGKRYVALTAGHSAEPCGREGATRFLEDLLIAATTTPDKAFTNGSGLSGTTYVENAGDILAKTKIFFILPSPDGWLSGDGMNGRFSQYNGAGINSNRLAYSDGWVFPYNTTLFLRGYTTYTQPEGIATTQYLTQVREKELHGKPFAVAMDMHGPLPAGFILLHDEGQSALKLNQMLDLGLRVKQEMEETTPAFGPAGNANDSVGVGPLWAADTALDTGLDAARDNTPESRDLGTNDNTVWRSEGNGRWAFVTHIVDSALGYTAIGSWGGFFSSNSGLDAVALSYEINCRAQGPWLPADEQLWLNNTRKALEAGVVTAAAWPKIHEPKVHMHKRVGFFEPGTRVTDADGAGDPVPGHFPDNALARQLHQVHYDVENTDYFRDLKPVVNKPPVAVAPDAVSTSLKDLDTFVVDDTNVDDVSALRSFVDGGGDLVLTDSALKMVPSLTKIPSRDVEHGFAYVGYSDLDRSNPLTKGLLDTAWQTFAPAPIGYPLLMSRDGYWDSKNSPDASNRSPTRNSAPIWTIDRDAWEAAGGTTIGTADPPKNRRAVADGTAQDKTEIGTLPVGKGRIVIFGALLPQPTEKYPHWFGLDAYSMSEAGQKMLLRVLSGQF